MKKTYSYLNLVQLNAQKGDNVHSLSSKTHAETRNVPIFSLNREELIGYCSVREVKSKSQECSSFTVCMISITLEHTKGVLMVLDHCQNVLLQ